MKGDNMEEVKRINPVPPRELKTVEIDVEKKIFRVNGEDFSKVTGFNLSCKPSLSDREKDWFKVILSLESNIRYLNEYDINGNLTSENELNRGK